MSLFPDCNWPPSGLYTRCTLCGEDFTLGVNVFTQEGAKETQISGTCEKCFDAMFEDMDNDYDYDIDDEEDF